MVEAPRTLVSERGEQTKLPAALVRPGVGPAGLQTRDNRGLPWRRERGEPREHLAMDHGVSERDSGGKFWVLEG